MKPSNRQLPGAIRDHAKALTTINNKSGAHAPCPRNAQARFQLTPHSHHAIHTNSKTYGQPSAINSYAKVPRSLRSRKNVSRMAMNLPARVGKLFQEH